ncbi:choice-of-anchor Q domain-containing protein [Spirosoma validum]|uniref:Right-handed parallel beta-helix repeat-containing protein n=1 Tax=Spirosoma validum TaxID=2771355 RepID=A0A927GBT0_9BACT|nr:choice-of-anchor Q domain-containing protein [Spirosoma validum]MBD2751929.1 hypothetical protein [Spirosoma validum]
MLYTLCFQLKLTAQSNGPVRYVKSVATGDGDGSSWGNASSDLQAMINAEGTKQVWVAAGTYKPTSTTARDISFAMKDGVAIYGGFVGNESLLSQRPAIGANPSSSTLSGDIGQAGDKTDNSYHILVNPEGLTATAILDGFVITNAYRVDEGQEARGGGLYNMNSSPTLRNCVFTGNFALYRGGAIYNVASYTNTSSPTLSNCSFQNNLSIFGGAIYNESYVGGICNPALTNCSFQSNTATTGGAIFNDAYEQSTTNPMFTNCTFRNNFAYDDGGAMYNSGYFAVCTPTIINCVAFGNGETKTFSGFNNGFLTAHYCLIDQSAFYYAGTNNLTIFTFPFLSDNDSKLKLSSPGINSGSNQLYSNAAGPPTDLSGNVRIQNGTIDRGAYETALPPDLTAILYVRPSTVNGSQLTTLVVDVVELNLVTTSGSFSVRVSKDSKASLSFDPGLTQVDGRSVQNGIWSLDNSNPNYYILTTSQPILAGNKLSFGLTGSLNPGASSGIITVSATVLPSTVVEFRLNNNIDTDKIEYFQQ